MNGALPGLGGAGQQLDPALQRALASMVESNADQFSEMSGLSVLRNRIHDHAQQRVERPSLLGVHRWQQGVRGRAARRRNRTEVAHQVP